MHLPLITTGKDMEENRNEFTLLNLNISPTANAELFSLFVYWPLLTDNLS